MITVLVIAGVVLYGFGILGTWEMFRLVDEESPTKIGERMLAAVWPLSLPMLGVIIIVTAPGDKRRAERRD